jgi:hypothetical protein
MYFLCVDCCSLSCLTVIKHFVLHQIKAYIYQTNFFYFGDSSCRCSVDITKKYQPSLFDALIKDQFNNVYRRGDKGYVFIYIHITYSFENEYECIYTHTHTHTHTQIHFKHFSLCIMSDSFICGTQCVKELIDRKQRSKETRKCQWKLKRCIVEITPITCL